MQFHRGAEASRMSRRRPLPWTATVINWPGIMGGGNTRQEALEDLRRRFEQFKAAKKDPLPRPGTKVPIQFAGKTRVNRHANLAKDFIERVLGVKWAWISDESTLSDFCDDETNDALIQKIYVTYGVDASDISSGNLADIFDRIAARADLSA